MFLRAACAFLAIVAVSMEPQTQDTDGAVQIKVQFPLVAERTQFNLKVTCIFSRDLTDWTRTTKLRIVEANNTDPNKDFDLLAAVNSKALIYGPRPSRFTASGALLGADNTSEVTVTIGPQESGYCKIYKCVATGRDANSQKVSIYAEREITGFFGAKC